MVTAAYCPRCGAIRRYTDDTFCRACGAAFAGASPGSAPVSQPGPAPYAVPAGTAAGVASWLDVRPIPLIGALAVAVAAFLPWFNGVAGAGSANGFDVPYGFLIDPAEVAADSAFTIGLAMLLIGIAGAVLAAVGGSSVMRRLLGTAAGAIAGVYIAQLARFVGEFGGEIAATDLLGIGTYVAIGGGVLLGLGK
jgi:hypothetical protein